jgi:excisionase family DNA binding protein
MKASIITPMTPLSDLPEYLTIREVCAFLRVSKNTVYKSVRSGVLESKQFAERKTLIPRHALEGKASTRPDAQG